LDVESKVQLGKEVTNVDWSGENITIACADGSSYQADHVIFTASLGVLKDRHATLFTPKLPANKVKAIESIGFGALGKIFLEFEEVFWPANDTEWLGYAFLWTEEEKQDLIGTGREW
jgi:spermine oxidase